MSPRSCRRLSGSCSDDLQQVPPRKRPGYWLTPPKSSVNCANPSAIQVSGAALADSSSVQDAGVVTEPIRKKRKYALLGGDMEEERVTRDLCTSFQNVESTESRKLDVVPWRSISNSSNGMDLQQSGTTSEEDLIRDSNDDDSADTVRSAAELLTQLTCGRNVDTNGQFPDVTSCAPYSRDAGQASEEPIRWGVKKKVSYETRRSVDSCDLGLCTGLIRKFSYDQDKTSPVMPAHTPDQKIERAFDSGRHDLHSTAKKGDQASPNCPASSEYYRELGSSAEAGTSFRLQLPGVTPQGPREKQNKIPSTSRTCPGNILKLPKEMQGRWSCERYKTAQLKLIDIMHARKAVPGKPILRPALREEARKHIGDTGLLDHLLKHMTDTVVSTGERFRRRHNSEGAMEYWLEHASLMELRKAAGVEDPSWIPPLGWKAGDMLPDRNWQLNRGMTSSEAAEMKNLKETVERLKSEMKVLCGSIKVSNQRGLLTGLSVTHQKPSEDVPVRAEEEENLIQGIRKDMIQFKTEMTNTEQQFHQERKSGAIGLGTTVERFQKLESEVLQMQEDRTQQKEIPLISGNQVDLEGQLQDVRKTVAVMQADVSYIIKMLGIVPPIKATPVRYPLDPSTPGKTMPLMLSTGDDTSITYRMSPEFQPPGTSEPVLHEIVIPNLEAPMRQCSSLKNAIRSSSGGNMMDSAVPYTDGLSQALSNYKLVNQPGLFPAPSRVDAKKKQTESTMSTHECVPSVAVNTKQRRAPNFKPMFTSQPTGFRICRPPGSFVWPSMMSYAPVLPTNNPPMTRQDQTVELRGLEDGSGNSSSRQMSGIPMSSSMAPVKQANYPARSIAESQVAATMASMFGCMATAPHISMPTLPLMTNEIDLSVKGTVGTATNNLGQCSSPAGQSDPALSLSLSLSVPSEIPHSNVALKKQRSI